MDADDRQGPRLGERVRRQWGRNGHETQSRPADLLRDPSVRFVLWLDRRLRHAARGLVKS